MTDPRKWRDEMRSLIANHDADAALALLAEARDVMTDSEVAPLLEVIDHAWGRAMFLANIDLDTLSLQRSAALATRAVATRSLYTSEVTALKPKELAAGFLGGSPQPSYVICRKALTWNLDTWAVCEFFHAVYKGGLRNLTFSEGFAPDPAMLQRALRAVGFRSIADDLPIVLGAASKGSLRVTRSESCGQPLRDTAPSADTIVSQAITEAVAYLGVSAMGPVLTQRYASIAPGLAEWRKLGAVVPAERWVFGVRRPRSRGRRTVQAPPDPTRRRAAIPTHIAYPWSAFGADATNGSDVTAKPKTTPHAAVIWVSDKPTVTMPSWSPIRASTTPDLTAATTALNSLPVRLLAVHAATQLRGAPVLGAMLRLGLLTNSDWWAKLAKNACSEGSVTDSTAQSLESLMSKRQIGRMLNAASRVASAIPALIDLVRRAACLRVEQSKSARLALYSRDSEDPSLFVSIAFVVAAVRAASASEETEAGEWLQTATETIRIRPRSPRNADVVSPPILLRLPDAAGPGSVESCCLASLGVEIVDNDVPAGKL